MKVRCLGSTIDRMYVSATLLTYLLVVKVEGLISFEHFDTNQSIVGTICQSGDVGSRLLS